MLVSTVVRYILKKTINHPNLHQKVFYSSNTFISKLYKVLSEKILVTFTFLKMVDSLMSCTTFLNTPHFSKHLATMIT